MTKGWKAVLVVNAVLLMLALGTNVYAIRSWHRVAAQLPRSCVQGMTLAPGESCSVTIPLQVQPPDQDGSPRRERSSLLGVYRHALGI